MTTRKPKIGIALGAGAVRGMAHVGILKVLEENGITPDCITGTSVGSIIGAIYASGKPPEWIETFLEHAHWKELLDFTEPKTGFIAGRRIEEMIQKLTKNKNFDELKIQLRVIATDILNNEKVVFKEGNVAKATRASMAIPGIFDPIIIQNKKLVDGAIVDPIPTEELENMGADIIIAVDLSINIQEYYITKKYVKEQGTFAQVMRDKFITDEIKLLKESIRKGKLWVPRFILPFVTPLLKPKRLMKIVTGKQTPELIEIMLKSIDILGNELSKEKLKHLKIDVIIKPEFHDVKWAEFDKTEHCIRAGEVAAIKALPKIKKAIKDFENGKR